MNLHITTQMMFEQQLHRQSSVVYVHSFATVYVLIHRFTHQSAHTLDTVKKALAGC